MTEDRQRVLDMLSEGKITVEEAERLLKALGAGRDFEAQIHGAVGEGLEALDRLGESIAAEVEDGIRKRVTVVLDKEDEESTRDDTFEVGENPRLEVHGFNGRVRVNAGGPGSIRVQAELRNHQGVKYTAVQEGDLVKVEAAPKRRSGSFLSNLFGQGSCTNIDVTVPATTRVDLATSNGRIELRGTESGGTLKTSNARIRVEKIKGDLTAQTSNGRITVETLEGSADLTTSNSRVVIVDGHGQFDVTTSNGRIEFQGSMEPGSRNRLTTSNGRIEVALDADPSLKVEASTVNGRARCEAPGFAASVDTGRKLEGTVGEGEAELIAKTANGSITIR